TWCRGRHAARPAAAARRRDPAAGAADDRYAGRSELLRAVVLTAPRQHEIRSDVPVPRPGNLEVLCKVEAVAICGTDVHIYEGRFPGRWPRGYPFIPGHEWSGTIVEAGSGAAELGWKPGERVAGTSHAGCGYCRMCAIGR